MSDKMPYYAIDKVAATISLDAKARVKWENRAKAVNVPLCLLLSLFLTEEVQRT